jgi:hypothetical protein
MTMVKIGHVRMGVLGRFVSVPVRMLRDWGGLIRGVAMVMVLIIVTMEMGVPERLVGMEMAVLGSQQQDYGRGQNRGPDEMEVGESLREKEKRQGRADERSSGKETLGTGGPEALSTLNVEGDTNAVGKSSYNERNQDSRRGRPQWSES